jgi:hypothetical protein
MTDQLHSKLQPVQRRQLLQSITSWAIYGLMIGAAMGIVFASARLVVRWIDGGWMARACSEQ